MRENVFFVSNQVTKPVDGHGNQPGHEAHLPPKAQRFSMPNSQVSFAFSGSGPPFLVKHIPYLLHAFGPTGLVQGPFAANV